MGGKKIDDVIGHVVWQPYLFLTQKPSKISERAEHIKAKLYKYDRLSTRNKKFFTYDVTGHMGSDDFFEE